jgi:hypothetical protein
MGIRVMQGAIAAICALGVAACAEKAAEAPHSGTHGRVFFAQPKNGDTIKTMSTIQFANEGVTIAAVPPGELTPAQVRPGMTHYHLGVDTDCLPTGQVIPKADPWIHFGTGATQIEMQLKPGSHKLVLQSGDDMHRTVEGLCEVITVNVVE